MNFDVSISKIYIWLPILAIFGEKLKSIVLIKYQACKLNIQTKAYGNSFLHF